MSKTFDLRRPFVGNNVLGPLGLLLVFILRLTVAGDACAAEQQVLNQPPAGFTALFNGENLDGWFGWSTEDPSKLREKSPEDLERYKVESRKDIREHWRVEKGELVNDGHGLFLTTNQDYRDFEMLVEYKTVSRADSGIYLRGVPQVQIWDSTDEAKWERGADKGSGGLWNNSAGAPGKDPSKLMDKPFGQWNQFRILMVGERVTVFFNGEKVVDHAVMENYFDRTRPIFPTGPIQLQTHGGEIRWRNVFIREISAEEAGRVLAENEDAGFTPIFNGKNFDGWAGAVDQYEIVDGSIVCKKDQGGVIYTAEEYRDFVVRLEFQLPPEGNNGLAIRYSGKGKAAYQGMCELQVLDDTAKRYDWLDPRQAHGSAYGMAPAHQGYLRPNGEWNYQQVTVRGSTIQVELNGTQILDCDLSTITEYLEDKPHPGKNRTEGHFGFAGHRDPVAFRNLRIKKLEP